MLIGALNTGATAASMLACLFNDQKSVSLLRLIRKLTWLLSRPKLAWVSGKLLRSKGSGMILTSPSIESQLGLYKIWGWHHHHHVLF